MVSWESLILSLQSQYRNNRLALATLMPLALSVEKANLTDKVLTEFIKQENLDPLTAFIVACRHNNIST
jgi:hypothetical protein